MKEKKNGLKENKTKVKREKYFDIITKELFPLLKRLIKLILNLDIDEKILKEKTLSVNLPKFIEKRPI